MESLVNQTANCCILCKAISKNCDEGHHHHDQDKSGPGEDYVAFLFRILLEIPPKPGISLVVDGNLINADHLLILKSNLVRWCDQCSIAIQQARKLYQQIKQASGKFRKVQREIVGRIQKCIIDDDLAFDKVDDNYKAIWRQLCLQNEVPFHCDWASPAPHPVSTEQSNVQKEFSSCHGDDSELACENEEDVKTEEDDNEDKEEASDTKQQRILLIFPGKEGRNQEVKSSDNDSLSSGIPSDNDIEEEEEDDEEEIIENNTNSCGLGEGGEDHNDDPLAESLKEEPTEPDLEMDQPQDNLQEEKDTLQNYCTVCKRKYKNKHVLIRHNKSYHSGANKFKPINPPIPTNFGCPDPQCGKFFKNSTYLRMHLKRSHPQISSPPQRSTFQKSHPELYAKIVKNPDTNLFTCPFSTTPSGDAQTSCSKISKWRKPIEDHVRYKHLGEPGRYQCSWGQGCTRSFSVYNNYKSHMDRHKGTPRYKCDQCDKQFYSKNPFIGHQQREHEGGNITKPFVCETCGKAFSCRDNLYCHKSVTCNKPKGRPKKKQSTTQRTTGSKSNKINSSSLSPLATTMHMCHLCPKSFKSGKLLKEHLKRHGGTPSKERNVEVPWSAKNKYQCSVKGCRLRFPRTELLESHTKRVHGEDGEKAPKLKCQYCGKGFYLKKDLNHHEETHANEGKDPYGCKVCGKGFRTMTYLKYHQKHTHKMKLDDKRKVSKR